MAESSIKLLIDEQLWEELAARLCAKGFDAIHVNHIGYRSTDDDAIFAFAAKQEEPY